MLNLLFSTMFMGFSAWGIHQGYYGMGVFWALASLPYLIEMGLTFFVHSILREYVIMPVRKITLPTEPDNEEN